MADCIQSVSLCLHTPADIPMCPGLCLCLCSQLFGDSVDAHMAQEWCILLQQPLLFTPTGLKGNIAAFAAAVKAKAAAAGGVDTNTTASNTSDTTDEGCCKNRDVLYYCKPSDPAANRISIGMFHLPGVHLDGPYHTGMMLRGCVAKGCAVLCHM